MYIKSINPKKKEFVFATDIHEEIISFNTVLKSTSWKDYGVVVIQYKNNLGKYCTCSFTKDSFLQNLHHLPEDRNILADYDHDVLLHKLYGLLNGKSEEQLDKEISNIQSQRLAIEAKKSALREEYNQQLNDWFDKQEKANALAEEHLKQKDVLLAAVSNASDEDKTYAQSKLDEHIAKEKDLPEYVPNYKTVRPPVTEQFIDIPTIMAKMIMLALDEGRPEIDLTNVTIDHVTNGKD